MIGCIIAIATVDQSGYNKQKELWVMLISGAVCFFPCCFRWSGDCKFERFDMMYKGCYACAWTREQMTNYITPKQCNNHHYMQLYKNHHSLFIIIHTLLYFKEWRTVVQDSKMCDKIFGIDK